MSLTQAGINYICQNFGDINQCCVKTGLSWTYTSDGNDYPETGGTAQIVARLASGLIEHLTMTNPARDVYTKAELDAANGGSVTLEDAKTIANHDEPVEGQWCYGSTPPVNPWPLIGAGAIIAIIVSVILWRKH